MSKQRMSENRKALPKFFLIIVIAMVLGFVIGIGTAYVDAINWLDTAVETIHQTLAAITPYSIWVLTAGLIIPELVLYHQAKTRFHAWDGEDENEIEGAEENLSWVLLLTVFHMVLAFFFFGLTRNLEELHRSGGGITLLAFIVSMVVLIVIQQKVVDLIRKMNPEKQGSVYDMKFQKKWVESCDENEQRQIGQAAFQSFKAVNVTCIVLWIILMVGSGVYPIGVLPSFLVLLIFGISQVSYVLASIRLARHK